MLSPKSKSVDPSASQKLDRKPPEVQMIDVSELRPHPRQAEVVRDMRPTDFKTLLVDIKANDVQNPLIILADRTIVCGHQRHRAAVQLGLEKIPCIVRDDLGNADNPASRKLHLTDNLLRRELSPLDRARYTKELFELESGRPLEREKWDHHRQLAVRDTVGELLGCSGRNAARYLAVLNTPSEVQQAFDEGLLSLALTERVSFLKPEAQQRLAESFKEASESVQGDRRKSKHALGALVKTALKKARPRKVEASTPLDPLSALSAGLMKTVKGLESNREQIMANIHEAGEYGKPLQRQRLVDARSRCERLLEFLAEFEAAAAEPDARTTSMRKTTRRSGHRVHAITQMKSRLSNRELNAVEAL